MSKQKRNQLSSLGIPVVEHCNLNCKGCLHFCHRGQKPHYYIITDFIRDIRKIHEYYERIEVLRFYGGEPLLHHELELFILNARKEFPDAVIELLTNGILLRSMKETLIDIMKCCGVKICWSLYPIMSTEQVNDICDFLDKCGLVYEINRIHEFYACYDPGGNIQKEEAYAKCSGKHCHVLRNGKISVCPAPLVGYYLNKLGADIDFSDGILNLYQNLDVDEIDHFLHTPHNACKYCAPPRYYEWERQQDSVLLDDWII